jgi:UDP-glucose 4-epimerase
MSILVFGGAGFIGSHTVQKLKKSNNIEIICVDNLSSGNIIASKFSDRFIKADIRDYDAIRSIFSIYQPESVFHFAGLLSVPDSCDRPYDYFDTNVVGTVNLLKLCAEFGVNKFIFSSTVSVYGEGLLKIINEDSIKKPISHYGLTKKIAEDLIIQHALIYPSFNYHILRYANVSGAMADGSNGPYNWNTGQLIHNLCLQSFLEKKITVHGHEFKTTDGTCIRDYLHVSDLADAHLEAYKRISKTKSSCIWNCSYGRGFSVLEVIHAFEKVSGIKFNVEYKEPRKGDPALILTCNDKIKSESSWQPKYDNLIDICETTYNWALQNSDLIIGKVSKSF